MCNNPLLYDDNNDGNDANADINATAAGAVAAARRRMTSNKMKRMKQSGCKDQDELEEDNEELFAELGISFYVLYTLLLKTGKFSTVSS